MATSKKSSPSKRKPARGKAAAANAPDTVVADEAVGKADTVAAQTDDTVTASPSEKSSAADVSKDDTVAALGDDTIVAEEAEKPDARADEDTVKPADDSIAAVTPEVDPASGAEKVSPSSGPVHAKSEPNFAAVPAMVPVEAPEQRSVFFPMLLGGVAAAALGYFAAQYGLINDPTAALRSDLNAEKVRITALEKAEAPVADLSPLEAQLADLDARLKLLEDRPVTVSADGIDVDEVAAAATAAYARELEGLRESVETQRSEIQSLLNNAKTVEQATADAARQARAQTALAKIVSALDAGQPFAQPLADLKALDLGGIDPALDEIAADGAATLNMLQSEFPAQARAALAVARTSGEDGEQQNLGSFLKRSLGARSVTPREGNDPDAILSRAEAALNSGDLQNALTELDTLPEDAQAAIADWRAAADAHMNVRMATDALAQRLTAD
ncbi:MAG: hypothetical protein ABJN72_14150 [Sulfitobacter sp.]